MKLILFQLGMKTVLVYPDVADQDPTFTITETKIYVPVVCLSIQYNAKLLQKLKTGSKRTINWNKYLLKPGLLARSLSLNHLIEPSFQGINTLFVQHLKMMHKEQAIDIIFQI